MGSSNLVSTSNRYHRSDQARIAEREELAKEYAEKQLDLLTLENNLSLFAREYAQTIGKLLILLEEIQADIAFEHHRLDPTKQTQTSYQQTKWRAHASRVSVDDLLAQAASAKPPPSDDLQSLFRKVAKTIHPDLTVDPEEREFRTYLMAKANEAFKNRNQGALEQILLEWEEWLAGQNRPEEQLSEVDSIETEIEQLKKRINEINQKLAELRRSDLFRLMEMVNQAHLQSRDLLAEMETDLRSQIARAQSQLDKLKQQKRDGAPRER